MSQETKVIRASLTNTLKYMSRDNSRLIPTDYSKLNLTKDNTKFNLFMTIVAYIDQAVINRDEFK